MSNQKNKAGEEVDYINIDFSKSADRSSAADTVPSLRAKKSNTKSFAATIDQNRIDIKKKIKGGKYTSSVLSSLVRKAIFEEMTKVEGIAE